ncbi:MAG TPA: tetratricopeptide repeat protein [Minicystis sp.]|nr:tetratricopeptide repeat protein [Minicystis sp.]
MAVDRDKILQAAQKLADRKQFGKAIAELSKLVADDPKDVRTLLKIGDYYLKDDQPVEAITTYERVGQFYSSQGFALKAIAVYKQIREIIHKHVPHLEDRFGHIVPRLAEIYTQLCLTSDAHAAYDEVASRLQRAGRDRDAIDIFRKVVELDPQNPLPHLRLGEAYVRVKDFDGAIRCFGAAAEILLKLGRKDDALKVVERLLQHRQEARFARMAAEIYLERGGPTDGMAALTKLQICFKENPKDLDTLTLLAKAFDKLGQPAKSIEVQKEAARIAKEAGKTEAFAALLDQLVARAPNDEAVRALVAGSRVPGPPTAAPPPVAPPSAAPRTGGGVPSRYSIDVEVEDEAEEILEPDDVAELEPEPEPDSEQPFAMRPSYAAVDASQDPAVRARQAIAQAVSASRARDYDHAIATLVEAIDALPGSRELREKLCDVLIEAGDQPEAVRQMLAYARWLGADGDAEGAARVLDEVLLLEPGQADALAMLRDLGYQVDAQAEPAVDAPGREPPAYAEAAPAFAPTPTGQVGYDPNAPLPSYDLEEISAVEAMNLPPQAPPSEAAMPGVAQPLATSAHYAGPQQPFATAQLDDPFAADAPLPSFSLDDEATQFIQVPSAVLEDAQRERRARASTPDASAPRDGIAAPTSGSAVLDEEALEEVEFFASHGMFEEAKNLLDEQLARLPNHPLLLERKRELEAMAAGQGDGSGTRVVPRNQSSPAEDRSFDIAASLDALDALDAPAPAAAEAADDPRQVSVETVFEQFKQGVAAQISESDASTHYDLGVAYREMGLYTDAVNEFTLAARDPARACVCQSMIGSIWRQLGNVDGAVDAFILGLNASLKTREQELFLLYEIGDAYEAWRAPESAYHYFQQLAKLDPAYSDPRGDVAERVRRVEPVHAKAPARAVGAESMSDEFDAALDDLLNGTFPGGGKL